MVTKGEFSFGQLSVAVPVSVTFDQLRSSLPGLPVVVSRDRSQHRRCRFVEIRWSAAMSGPMNKTISASPPKAGR